MFSLVYQTHPGSGGDVGSGELGCYDSYVCCFFIFSFFLLRYMCCVVSMLDGVLLYLFSLQGLGRDPGRGGCVTCMPLLLWPL